MSSDDIVRMFAHEYLSFIPHCWRWKQACDEYDYETSAEQQPREFIIK